VPLQSKYGLKQLSQWFNSCAFTDGTIHHSTLLLTYAVLAGCLPLTAICCSAHHKKASWQVPAPDAEAVQAQQLWHAAAAGDVHTVRLTA
jgi:hypothetical protein